MQKNRNKQQKFFVIHNEKDIDLTPLGSNRLETRIRILVPVRVEVNLLRFLPNEAKNLLNLTSIERV